MGRKIRSKLDLFSPSDPIVNETRNDVRNQFKLGDTVLSNGFQISIALIRIPDG